MKRLATALIVAFVLAPATLAADRPTRDLTTERHLTDAFRSAFVVYWGSGDRAFDPGMQRVVDCWFRYHVAKALLATALVPLGAAIWRAYLRTGGLRRPRSQPAACWSPAWGCSRW